MSDLLGEWDAENGVERRVTAAVDSADVAAAASDLVAATVSAEIRRQVQETVAPIVAEAVAKVLTPDRLDELRDAATAAAEAELGPTAPDATQADAPPALYYGSVDEFVREMIVPVFRRKIDERGARRWCAEWWRSAEAIMRLEALWRSWEHLRLDPATGMSVWLRDHADHHLAVLMDPEGPWRRAEDSSEAEAPLPYSAPPEGLFLDVRET